MILATIIQEQARDCHFSFTCDVFAELVREGLWNRAPLQQTINRKKVDGPVGSPKNDIL